MGRTIIKRIRYDPKEIIGYIETKGSITATDLEKKLGLEHETRNVFFIISDLVGADIIVARMTTRCMIPLEKYRVMTEYYLTETGRRMKDLLKPKVISLIDISEMDSDKFMETLDNPNKPFAMARSTTEIEELDVIKRAEENKN